MTSEWKWKGSLVIYDGTFGPPHKGHVTIAELLDKVKGLPPPVKIVINVAGEIGKAGAWRAHDRLEVSKKGFSVLGDHALVSDFYITAGERENRYICTSEAVQHLRQDFDGYKVYLSGGADNFSCECFRKKRPSSIKRILDMYDGFIIIPRIGHDVDMKRLKLTLKDIVDKDEVATARADKLEIISAAAFQDKGWSSSEVKTFLFFLWAIQKLPEDLKKKHKSDHNALLEGLREMLTEEVYDCVMPGGVVKDLYATSSIMTACSDSLRTAIAEYKARKQSVEPVAKRMKMD